MASLPISFAPATARVYAATAAKGDGGGKQEKSLLDWILGNMQKEDQFYETDPILKKVEEKNPTRGTTNGRKNSVAVPQKKKGGFGLGGLFAKK
ncbi:Thylakoid soluble phosphoprotein [Melia azedarach]|uniref:Thylakoid soluble phosphoprotein n=2 Tax=Melia azedarach TaxID=155640 RepID=A0ACC1YQA1_MELAZ|nr:Thylakoid soluble phosphoprotein [Melia azedarach]KAJ4725622.1 Thylakoid soluble phosphoprotein [Melia azedarach]